MTEIGSLSSCILENDRALREKARWLRGKSLVASLAIEATIVVSLLMWPLLSPGVLGGRLIVTPLPPYGGNGETARQTHRPERYANTTSEPTRSCLFCARPVAPSRPDHSDGSRVQAPGGPPDLGLGPGSGSGIVIPGAEGDSLMHVEIKKPEPTQHTGPQQMSEGVMAAALIYKVQPEYPAMARIAHVSGTVRLRAIIGTDGRILQLEAVSGPLLLQGAAVAAVRNWRYRPTMLNGTAVDVETLITVKFILGES